MSSSKARTRYRRFADSQQRRRRPRRDAGRGRQPQRLRPLPLARAEACDDRPRADVPEVADFFVARKLDVAAGVRQQLEADAKRLPGLRVLDGRFMVINQAMGRHGHLAGDAIPDRVREHDEVLRILAQSLARHGIEGATVAP